MNVLVVIESQSGGKRTIQLRANGLLSIGRDPECGLRIKSDLISRQHAVVEFSGQAVRVEDRSTNGTLAGDQLLRKSSVWVPFGTPIVVGDHTLTFQSAGPPVRDDLRDPTVRGGHGLPPMPAPPPPMQQQQYAPPPPQQSSPHHPMPAPPGGGTLDLRRGPPQHSQPPPAPQPVEAAQRPGPSTTGQGGATVTGGRRKRTPEQDAVNELRRDIHRQLIENLDLAALKAKLMDDPSMRPKVIGALRRIVELMGPRIPASVERDRLVGELADEALGLGPLEHLLADPSVTEIMVVDPDTIYIERAGKIVLSDQRFTDDERVRAVIERIVTPLGRRIDESSPLVDARLKDGSRVNAVIKPIALRGSAITIRKFSKVPLTLEKLYGYNALSPQMGRFLTRAVVAKKNIIISGGTGSGKTTLLNILSAAIPDDERIVTIEDAAELQLAQPHVVSLETRPANMEGKGEYSIRDLLKNAMRMRPDRVVVGECRGGEALDMLQAMNTGHDGSLTTTHANSPPEALKRIETLCLMAGVDLPSRAVREQIAGSIHLVVQQSRFSDGTRKVSNIAELVGLDEEMNFEIIPIYQFVRSGTGPKGEVLGGYKATGYLPSFLNEFILKGLIPPGGPYL
ncbi:MAG: Flp pilus assembly complex ATPase component TadA [Polyangiaceae bacterium]|nr:Flp pilus assembly complex ATPase component TadA [Polyangiaceae bacterium]MCE7889224.1 FHA domain-containing protein [Sorangiineae bacterium PRO1]MCL4754867.1 Flp pilus assembly complex ATPase component TadA [Myxococcales bacterium]